MDVLIFNTQDGGDINPIAGSPEMRDTLESFAFLSLFGGNIEDDGRKDNLLTWWGNIGETVKYVSETQHLLATVEPTPRNLRRIEDAVKRDLGGFGYDIAARATMPGRNTVGLSVDINGVPVYQQATDWPLEVTTYSVTPPASIEYSYPPQRITGTAGTPSVTMSIYDATGAEIIKTVVYVVDGAYSYDVPLSLVDGQYTAVARAVDSDGRLSDGNPFITFTLDTTRPSPPVVTVNNGVALDGTGAGGNTVTLVLANETTLTTTVQAGGSWSFSPYPLAYQENAELYQTDPATNESERVAVVGVGVLYLDGTWNLDGSQRMDGIKR